jgi:hypothetical protein
MHRVWQGDVDGIHLPEALIVFVVGIGLFQLILSTNRLVVSSLTRAVSSELRFACANAGRTATWAMWPIPTTA